MIEKLVTEIRQNLNVIILTLLVIFISDSVYLIFSDDAIADIGDEDHIFEWLTAISFLVGSGLFLISYLKAKNIFLILLALMCFFGFGEEISWGQRLFNLKTPGFLKEINVQQEINIHNIEILNQEAFSGQQKKGIKKLLEINFLLKVFCISYCFVLPLLVMGISLIKRLALRIKLPVPSFVPGLLFLISWFTFRIILSYFLPGGRSPQYYDTIEEIFEFHEAFILMLTGLYFLNRRIFNDTDTERTKILVKKE